VRLTLTLCLAAALLVGCGRPPLPPATSPKPLVTLTPVPVQPRAEWTLLFYICADNDLETAEMDDLEELTGVESTDAVRMLALVDRSPLGEPSEGYTHRAVANLPNWSHAKLLEIQRDKLIELDDWGQLNLADPAPLGRLLSVARESYPARHYALFLIDHGQGWAGICSDDSASASDDSLRLHELSDTLRDSSLQIDLLGLDACQMSTIEVYQALARHTRWILASQDTLPGQGLAYGESLKKLAELPRSEARQLGDWFLDAYRTSLRSTKAEFTRLQLSLLDSRAQSEFASAWEALSRELGQIKASRWLQVARARASTQSFSSDEISHHGAELHDVAQLTENLEKAWPDLRGGARAVRQALRKVVARQVTGEFRRSCGGLSVFFPGQSEQMHELAAADYAGSVSEPLEAWVQFLKTYTDLERGLQKRPQLGEVTFSSGDGKRIHLRARVGALETVKDAYTILVQDQVVIGQIPCHREPDSTYLSDFYDGRWLSIQEKPGGPSIPAHLDDIEAVSPESQEALVSARCQLRRAASRSWIDVRLYFALQVADLSKPARFAGATRSNGLGVIDTELHPGDQIRFLRRGLRAGAQGTPGPQLPVEVPRNLTLRPAAVPVGNYQLGFLIRDLQGRAHWQTRPLLWGE
jgi:hypothetical protein